MSIEYIHMYKYNIKKKNIFPYVSIKMQNNDRDCLNYCTY